MVWHGVTAPPMTPSCACWNMPQSTTTTTIVIDATANGGEVVYCPHMRPVGDPCPWCIGVNTPPGQES